MKFLHTADWHVGRTLRGRSRADEHRAVLDEIARIATAEHVELVLVAGDLFDTAAPSPEAEQIVYSALMQLAATGAEVVVIAGNHDNPHRLKAVRPLLDLTRVHTVAFVERPQLGGVIELSLRSGTTVRIAALPFLSQRGIIRAEHLMSVEADTRVETYADRCRLLVDALCKSFHPRCVNIVVSHLTVVGGVLGGGERDVHTVFDYHVPPQIFPVAAHYVALGHLHRAQQLAGPCPIWYSGAPLQLDFGETTNDPAVLVVEAAPGLPARVRLAAVTSGKRLRTLRGSLHELEAQRDSVGDDYLRLFVTGPPRAGLADDVRALFPNAVDVALTPAPGTSPHDEQWTLDHVRRSPAQLFAEYHSERQIDDPAMLDLFRNLLEQAVAND